MPDRRSGERKAGEVECGGLLLWLIGIPIPVIVLLYFFHVI
jgi:hypothetical protein